MSSTPAAATDEIASIADNDGPAPRVMCKSRARPPTMMDEGWRKELERRVTVTVERDSWRIKADIRTSAKKLAVATAQAVISYGRSQGSTMGAGECIAIRPNLLC